MASIMICSSLWGVRLGEWAGASPRALAFIRAGIGTLVLSTVVVVRRSAHAPASHHRTIAPSIHPYIHPPINPSIHPSI
jgi:hypothetical protein